MAKRNRSANVDAILGATQEAVEQAPIIETVTPTDAPKSIRQLIMAGIAAGKSTADITAEVRTFFPNTAAATKSTKHIAWYRSRMKKDARIEAEKQALLAKIDAEAAS